MRSLETICTDLNRIAHEAGGDHYTGKEIEELLLAISDEIDEVCYHVMNEHQRTHDALATLTGMSDKHYQTAKESKMK